MKLSLVGRLIWVGGVIAALPLRAGGPDSASRPVATEVGAAWSTDYVAALRRAGQENKVLLLDFTGSDWCVWCKRLHAEVFSQPPFADYAREHLILVTLDAPAEKSQPAAERRQVAKLAQQFGVSDYPTIILVDAAGRELGRTGYMEGGAKTFVRELKRIVANPLHDPPAKPSPTP